MIEVLVWVSLLSLIIKRRIGFSVQKVTGVELSMFMIAKNAQGWFYPLMESIVNKRLSTLRKVWTSTIEFLSKYAKRATPDKDKKEVGCNMVCTRLPLNVQPMDSG